MITPKIFTLNAEKLLTYCCNEPGSEGGPVCFDARNNFVYRQVVKQLDDFDECPMLHQIIRSKTFTESGTDTEISDDWLLDKLMIVDFGTIFSGNVNAKKEDRREHLKDKVKTLIENGLTIVFNDHSDHMLPFDKSGNMSRHSRITFINEEYFDELNERLDLGMDFDRIKVILSKYYAYRGLYLTSSKRIEHNDIMITPETLVIVNDDRINEIFHKSYEKGVQTVTAVFGDPDDPSDNSVRFQNEKIEEMLEVETPFDGEGIVSPDYARFINESLGIGSGEASSFQLRMPFVKGVLHKVDFAGFLGEFDHKWNECDSYEYFDAFKVKRDLKKAKILLTTSMFKCMKWLKKYCKENHIEDPMQYYCDAMNRYGHGLYISSTDLPYGKCEYTHLSYQMLNTLDLTDAEFENIMSKHESFIKEPLSYIDGWDPATAFDNDDIDEVLNPVPAWRKAVRQNRSFKDDSYISSRIKNTAKGLITKIAKGKLTVAGQTRFLCRDLMPVMVSLIGDPLITRDFYKRCLFFTFFMPLDEATAFLTEKYPNLKYGGFCALLRNPHLSRNEECLCQPFAVPEDPGSYFRTDKMPQLESHVRHVKTYEKYFGHLTGVVMVPRGSSVPLCLGGADFDGDLVSVIYDENVVNAVRRWYKDAWLSRKLPVIEIPDLGKKKKIKKQTVPSRVPYDHIEKTFSNSIGYLSNMAISIGQKEYGHDESASFDPKGATCWKCTLLTGLDIDAAKNGKHPDLDIITKNEALFPRASYLDFKEGYERLRRDPDYSFERMSVEIREKNGVKSLEVGCRDAALKVSFLIGDKNKGTKINELPLRFAKAYKNYSENRKHGFVSPFECNRHDLDTKRELIEKYRSDCSDVISLYFRYAGLCRRIRFEKDRSGFAAKNIYNQVIRTYDEKNAIKIYDEIIPSLIKTMDKCIGEEVSIKEIKERLNTEKWQYQPSDRREQALCSIIGKGSDISFLNDQQKEFLFCFDQHGYKMLWLILTLIEGNRPKPYAKIRDDAFAGKAKITGFDMLDKKLDGQTRYLYESDLNGADNRLYRICIRELRKLTDEYDLHTATKITTIYDLTGDDPRYKRFFWDTVTWDEIKPWCSGDDTTERNGIC